MNDELNTATMDIPYNGFPDDISEIAENETHDIDIDDVPKKWVKISTFVTEDNSSMEQAIDRLFEHLAPIVDGDLEILDQSPSIVGRYKNDFTFVCILTKGKRSNRIIGSFVAHLPYNYVETMENTLSEFIRCIYN